MTRSMSFRTKPLVPRNARVAYAGLRMLQAGQLDGVGTIDMDAVYRTREQRDRELREQFDALCRAAVLPWPPKDDER